MSQSRQQPRHSVDSAGTAAPANRNMAPYSHPSVPSRIHSEESWIEIGSGPSSSSLSSAAENEIITTGLRVQHDSNVYRRRRRARSHGQFVVGTGHRVTNTAAGGNSSQEEYDESESESDRVMTSSTEGIGPSPLQHELRGTSRSAPSVASSETTSEREDDDDDDENATAVNYPRSTRRQFEPRPNAFSHPPAQPTVRPQFGGAANHRRPGARPSSQRHSYPQHSPFDAVSSNTQTDHDEALRASLSTLLTAAAAVRGLPKPNQHRTAPHQNSNRIDPTTLRLVPESVALGTVPENPSSRTTSTGAPSASSPRTASSSPSDKSKRKATPPANASPRSSSKDRRATKKARKTGPLVDEISPTLLTWVVSAGVVVLVSALSFSAGYVIGKEAGHAEALGPLGAAGSEAGRCGKEAAAGVKGASMGLRRLRWTGGSGVRV